MRIWESRRLWWFAALAVVIAAPAMFASGAPSAPKSGGKLTVAVPAETTTFDVHTLRTSWTFEPNLYIYEPLVEFDEDGRFIPWLAERWRTAPDGLSVTVWLRKGVKFHDGTPFNAEAAKVNLDRILSGKMGMYAAIATISSVDVVDEHTVKLNLRQVTPPLIRLLAYRTFSMVSPAALQKYGKEIDRNPVGTGPYRFKEWRKGQYIRLVKSPDYWQAGKPYLDEITLRLVPDVAVRETMLETGEVDVIQQPSLVGIQRFQRNPRVTLKSKPSFLQYYVVINTLKESLRDVRVRKAVNHAVDKKGIAERVFFGSGVSIADAPIVTPGQFGYARIGTYEYNPQLARDLLAQAGWRDTDGDGIVDRGGRPLRLRFYSRRGGFTGDAQMAEVIQAQLKAVGVDVQLTFLESAIFLQTVSMPAERGAQPEAYDLVNLGIIGWGDAYTYMQLTISRKAWPTAGFNRMYWENPRAEALMRASDVEVSDIKRKAMYVEIFRLLYEDAPIIMLFNANQVVVMRANVHGVEIQPLINFPARFAWKES